MTQSAKHVYDIQACSNDPISTGSGDMFTINGRGKLRLVLISESAPFKLTLSNVATIPDLQYNLISPKPVVEKDCQ